MNSINVNIPVVNLPQVSHHQSDTHRTPMTHQVQNSDMNRDRFEMQMRTAREAEAAEGKVIDPKDRREEKRGGGGKDEEKDGKRGGGGDDDGGADIPHIPVMNSDSGRLIDLEA